MPKNRYTDLKGRQFGELYVLRISTRKPHSGKVFWHCRCTCGTTLSVRHDYLIHSNHPKTHCGCKNKGACTLHNGEYRIWYGMVNRCTNSEAASYSYYGAKGITVCNRWMDFERFLEDMGKRPSKAHSLDRIDPTGNYEPGNVRWATDKQQARNKRDTIIVHDPKMGHATVGELAESQGITYQTMRTRLIKEGRWPNKT